LRLGFVIAPPWARAALIGVKQLADWHAPIIGQDTLAAFIAEGHLARHVRKMRKIYGERREILREALERFGGGRFRVVGIGAGLHFAAYLEGSLRASTLADRAAKAGFALDPMQRFSVGDRRSDGLVFGYGAIDAGRIAEAVQNLAALTRKSD
jgi:GntR family transcriptional regulator/MocR family aminotransferase